MAKQFESSNCFEHSIHLVTIILNLKQRAKRARKNLNISNFQNFHSVWKPIIWTFQISKYDPSKNSLNFEQNIIWKKARSAPNFFEPKFEHLKFQFVFIDFGKTIWNKCKFEQWPKRARKQFEHFKFHNFYSVWEKKTIWTFQISKYVSSKKSLKFEQKTIWISLILVPKKIAQQFERVSNLVFSEFWKFLKGG